MESTHSVMSQDCGKDTLIQNEDDDSECEEYYLVSEVQNQSEEHQQADMSKEDQHEDKLLFSKLCRVCANTNDHLIPIFDGEGAEHQLSDKIHKYLPIHVSEDDTLPIQLCYHCAATLLAWHELNEGCVNAEHRLLEMLNNMQNKLESSQESEEKTVACGEPVNNDDLERWQTETTNGIELLTAEIEDTNTKLQDVDCSERNVFLLENVKCFVGQTNAEHETEVCYCPYCKVVYCGQSKDLQEHVSAHKCSNEAIKSTTNSLHDPEHKSKKINPQPQDNPIREGLTYVCNLCETVFATKYELKKHISNHDNVQQKEDPDEMELVRKAKEIIDGQISYKCSTCKKVMCTKRGFLRHIRVHSGRRPCRCEFCGNCYRIEQDLARHIRDVHEGLKKYICDICGRAFANKGSRDDHRRIHTGERPYACEHCPKTFRTLNSVYVHNRVHTNYKPHRCSYCNKQFRNRQRLNNHETTHTHIKAFSCEICGKSFSVKEEVARHRAVHNTEKPFNCKSCNAKFSQKRYLRNHIKQHHKEESFFLLSELTGKRN